MFNNDDDNVGDDVDGGNDDDNDDDDDILLDIRVINVWAIPKWLILLDRESLENLSGVYRIFYGLKNVWLWYLCYATLIHIRYE